MVSKVDKFTSYILAFDEDEIDTIISTLISDGEDDLAYAINKEVYGSEKNVDQDCISKIMDDMINHISDCKDSYDNAKKLGVVR